MSATPLIDGTQLVIALRRVAREAGATAVAVADASRSTETFERLAASFGRGDLQTWGYDAAYAARASDPAALLPGARSVVCVAVSYATRAPQRRPPLHGRVSNYAWSADYHVRVRAILERIAREIDDAAGGAATRIVCDTAPLAERAFAARAGLGWIGKHTNLIAPALGSFVFLGEIVTTLALPPDAPLRKTCGTCARCVTACPTGALRGDYTIDATRCISDLTQRTDGIPRALRVALGDWVWGCDLCQTACPPTQRARAVAGAEFAPLDDDGAAPSLVGLLALRSGVYKRRYRATAMGWRGAAVLRRNAAVALGNALDRASVPALAVALASDPHPMVRGHAAWALGRIGSPRALAVLAARAACECDEGVRAEVGEAQAPWKPFLRAGR